MSRVRPPSPALGIAPRVNSRAECRGLDPLRPLFVLRRLSHGEGPHRPRPLLHFRPFTGLDGVWVDRDFPAAFAEAVVLLEDRRRTRSRVPRRWPPVLPTCHRFPIPLRASARALPVLPSDADGASVAAGSQGPHPCNPVLRQPAVPELSAARHLRSRVAATMFSSER
jgi:hypothetical protein